MERPIAIASEQENPTGAHVRYNVTKANGEPVDPNAIYFVLRLDNEGDDKDHVHACRQAVIAYAASIMSRGKEHPLYEMAKEWMEVVTTLEKEQC